MSDTFELNNFDVDLFLTDYWQKKPFFIKNSLPESVYKADKNVIAGLACEPEAESRLIFNAHEDRHITVEEGPFTEERFSKLEASNWSLMVQKCDIWLDQTFEIRKYFAFLPHWRFDDIMASYGTDKSSSGPHIDNYDVFLLQSEGQKTWRVENLARPLRTLEEKEFIPDLEVRILQNFKDSTEYIMNPGDMLYIPAGYAHWGVSKEETLSFSIGFRAPSIKEIAKNFFYDLIEKIDEDLYFSEKTFFAKDRPGHIPESIKTDIEKDWPGILPELNETITQRFAEIVTSAGQEYQPPAEDEITKPELLDYLNQNLISRGLESRLAYTTGQDKVWLYADGNKYELESKHLPLVEHLCNNLEYDCSLLANYCQGPEAVSLLNKLISTSSLSILKNE